MFTVTRERPTGGPRTAALSRGNLGMRRRPPRPRHLARATPELSRKKEKIKNFHVASIMLAHGGGGGGVDPRPRGVVVRHGEDVDRGENFSKNIRGSREKKNEIFKITGEKFEIKNLNFLEIKHLKFLFYPPGTGVWVGGGGRVSGAGGGDFHNKPRR